MTTASIDRVHTSIGRPSFARRIGAALQLRSERMALRNLTEAELRDVGLTRADAQAEADRPIWDAPHHWHTKT